MYLVRWVELQEQLYWLDPLPRMVRRELWRDFELKAVVSNGVAAIPMQIGFRVLTSGPQEFVLTFESNEAIVSWANAPLWLSGRAEQQTSGTYLAKNHFGLE